MSHVFDPFSGQICGMVLNGLWYCCVAVQPHNIHSLCLDWDGSMSLWWPILVVQSQRPSGTLALRRVTLLWQRCCYFFQATRLAEHFTATPAGKIFPDDVWWWYMNDPNNSAGGTYWCWLTVCFLVYCFPMWQEARDLFVSKKILTFTTWKEIPLKVATKTFWFTRDLEVQNLWTCKQHFR